MIVGLNGETAIPKAGGGYTINYGNPTRNKYNNTTMPKIKTTIPKPAVPKVTAPRVTTPAPSPMVQAASAPTPAPPPVAAAPTLDDIVNKYYSQSTGDVNSLYDKQSQSQLAALKAQRDAAIGKINQQQDVTKQDYYNQRNQADVVNAQNVQKLRELMASNGISASGDNLTLNAKANSDRMNSLNSLNQQEQAKMNDYASQITDWNNPSRDAAVTNQIEAARTQALLNAKQAAYQRAWQEFNFNNMSASQQAQLAMSKYNTDSTNVANSASSQAALDYYNNSGFNGSSGGGGTAGYQSDLQKAISRGLDPSWSNAMNYIVQHESGYNSGAKNPSSTAHGYAQFLNSTASSYDKKMGLNYNSSPVDQLLEMQQYLKDRYGTPQGAVNFWAQHKWY